MDETKEITLEMLYREIRSLSIKIDERFDKVDSKFITVDKRFEAINKRIDLVHGKVTALERGQRDLLMKYHVISLDIEKIKNLYDSLDDKLESSMVVSNKVFQELSDRIDIQEDHYIDIKNQLSKYGIALADKDNSKPFKKKMAH